MAGRKEYTMDFILAAKLNGGFSSQMNKAQQEFVKVSKAIQDVNRKQADISSYTKQQKAVEQTASKLENLQKQHDLLQREISETEGSTAALEREKLKLEQRIESTQNALTNQQNRLEQTSERLEEAGVDTNNLAQESQNLENELHELTEQQDRAAQEAQEFGDSNVDAMSAIGDAIAAVGLVEFLEKVGSAYKACIQIAASLEEQMSTVQAISGATDDEAAQLADKAKEMGASTKFTATESAQAYEYMARHTWPTAWRHAA